MMNQDKGLDFLLTEDSSSLFRNCMLSLEICNIEPSLSEGQPHHQGPHPTPNESNPSPTITRHSVISAVSLADLEVQPQASYRGQ